MKLIFAFTILFLAQSCSWLESDYDKLMNPIKAIKLSEKKAGKENPIFDGVREPDFPDEKLNNETLEGVDSNHDGVRDDIEIWINRTAEDDAIRLAKKDIYKKELDLIISVKNRSNVEQIMRKFKMLSSANHCLSILSSFLSEEYLKKYTQDSIVINMKFSNAIFYNSQLRKKIENEFDKMSLPGVLDDENRDYCFNTSYGHVYKNRLQEISKKYNR